MSRQAFKTSCLTTQMQQNADKSREKLPVDGEIPPRDGNKPAVSVPEVSKQHDVFARAITVGILGSAYASI